MEKLRVSLEGVKDDSYDIILGSHLMESIADGLLRLNLGKVCVVTDLNVKREYGEQFHAVLKSRGMNAVMIALPPGRNDREMKASVEDIMLKNGLGRESVILALGGGTVIDVAGFVSSTYHGGIPYLMLPTTLFSMVDHALGGRVGVDTPFGRKVIGAYYRPKRVLCDFSFLRTLPPEEVLRGVVEMFRIALVSDSRFCVYIEDYYKQALALDESLLQKMALRTLELKHTLLPDVSSLRFGTRMAHAFSGAGSPDWRALGLVAELRLAEDTGIMNPVQSRNAIVLLEKMGCVVTHNLDVDVLFSHLSNRQFYLPRKIGDIERNVDVSEELIRRVLEGMKG